MRVDRQYPTLEAFTNGGGAEAVILPGVTDITAAVLRDRALAALASINPATVASVRLTAVRIVRDSGKDADGCPTVWLDDVVDAVDWAIRKGFHPTA